MWIYKKKRKDEIDKEPKIVSSPTKEDSVVGAETVLSQSAIEVFAGKTIQVEKLSDLSASIDSKRPRAISNFDGDETFLKSKATTVAE